MKFNDIKIGQKFKLARNPNGDILLKIASSDIGYPSWLSLRNYCFYNLWDQEKKEYTNPEIIPVDIEVII